MDTLTVMTTRIKAGRSPFAADRNHIHHRLLSLGFAHREAVLTVYVAQCVLVLIAFFLRFQSDATVFLAFCTFVALVLISLRWAATSGWRLEQVQRDRGARRYLNGMVSSTRIPQVALIVMTTCLGLYVATVLASSQRVSMDLGLICLGMLALLLALSSRKSEKSLLWFERIAAYVSVVFLVYLDQTAVERAWGLTTLSWTLVAIIGTAALLRFWFSPTRRFEVTTLDLLVIVIAIMLPNLPGSVALPPGLSPGVAKAVILLYVIEMLLTVNFRRLLPRVCLLFTLAIIAGRAFVGITT
jgi:UDP-GlcNAc:undecaprenyl-phosphate GlcNAc-1-phosphate transferase